MSFALDLHTHSIGSTDGGLTLDDYQSALSGGLHYIAITDHDTIKTAQDFKAKLGASIIVGQEITTLEGEIIGLFLSKRVQPGRSAQQTVADIKSQGGLVYIPHPFETVRKGLTKDVLDSISENVDVIETFNGRAFFQNRGPDALTWARLHRKASCSSSDAHGRQGLGKVFTTVSEEPQADTLVSLLQTARLTTARPGLRALLYPKLNRFRGKIVKRL